MSETGTLSYDEFENELRDLIERAKVSQDSWNLHFSKVIALEKLSLSSSPFTFFHCGIAFNAVKFLLERDFY